MTRVCLSEFEARAFRQELEDKIGKQAFSTSYWDNFSFTFLSSFVAMLFGTGIVCWSAATPFALFATAVIFCGFVGMAFALLVLHWMLAEKHRESVIEEYRKGGRA